MFRTVKTIVVSALIGAGALSFLPATAQADSLHFSLGVGDPRGDVIVDDGYNRVQDWRRPGWNEPEDWDRPRWDRPRRDYDRWDRQYQEGCSPRHALRKAYRMGLDRPFIARDNRRMIVVAGRGDRGRQWINFARVPGCPVIR